MRDGFPIAPNGLMIWQAVPEYFSEQRLTSDGRCLTGRNGATWQVEQVTALEAAGASRDEALHGMLTRYTELMHSNEPVHTWEVGRA